MLDVQAATNGISRSELIERICRSVIMGESPEYVEFFRFFGAPTEVPRALSGVTFHDEDGPIECVLRVTQDEWDRREARRKQRREATT